MTLRQDQVRAPVGRGWARLWRLRMRGPTRRLRPQLPRRQHRGPRVGMLLCVGLLASAGVGAVGPSPTRGQVSGTPAAVPTIAELARELGQAERPRRLLAARELARQARSAQRATATKTARSTLAGAEALQALDDLDRVGGPACVEALEHRELRRPCARMLVRIDHAPAVAALCAAAAHEPRRRVQRVLLASAEQLLSQPAEAAPTACPGPSSTQSASNGATR